MVAVSPGVIAKALGKTALHRGGRLGGGEGGHGQFLLL